MTRPTPPTVTMSSIGAVRRTPVPRLAVMAMACVALLQGCNRSSPEQAMQGTASSVPASVPMAVAVPPAASTASVAPSYQRLSADQLYQMVAPIALFPDRLLAQVLAGATHPDQIPAAQAWRAQQNGDPSAVQNAADQQPWDVSVKALTAFPDVLAQMAQNMPWTTALGQAYANDSSDVMNAIQELRQRASQSGHLKSTPEWSVASAPYTGPATPSDAGEVVPPPSQVIAIDPTPSGMVYVPHYDPTVVYGTAVPLYPDYEVVDTGPVYRNPDDPLVTGLVAFGAGVAIASVLDHHDWGWNAWGMNWGHHHHDRDHHDDDRPSVTYNNTVYTPGRGTWNGPGRFQGPGDGHPPDNPGRPGQPPMVAPPGAVQNVRPGNERSMTIPQFHPQNAQPGAPQDRRDTTLRPTIQDFQQGHEPVPRAPGEPGHPTSNGTIQRPGIPRNPPVPPTPSFHGGETPREALPSPGHSPSVQERPHPMSQPVMEPHPSQRVPDARPYPNESRSSPPPSPTILPRGEAPRPQEAPLTARPDIPHQEAPSRPVEVPRAVPPVPTQSPTMHEPTHETPAPPPRPAPVSHGGGEHEAPSGPPEGGRDQGHGNDHDPRH